MPAGLINTDEEERQHLVDLLSWCWSRIYAEKALGGGSRLCDRFCDLKRWRKRLNQIDFGN
jgi:hypothetical protein